MEMVVSSDKWLRVRARITTRRDDAFETRDDDDDGTTRGRRDDVDVRCVRDVEKIVVRWRGGVRVVRRRAWGYVGERRAKNEDARRGDLALESARVGVVVIERDGVGRARARGRVVVERVVVVVERVVVGVERDREGWRRASTRRGGRAGGTAGTPTGGDDE